MKKIFLFAILLLGLSSVASAEDFHQLPPKKLQWSFDGVFGKFDKQSIQRGFQIYKEVCSTCHSLKRIAFRNLIDIGFTEEEAKAVAASYTINYNDENGNHLGERPGKISDSLPSPFLNEAAARSANNGALPPDLSLIIKARENGANYVYSLLTGFQDAPSGVVVPSGMYYNPYFPGGQIAMSPPLTEKMTTYQDETIPSVDNMARDVVNFLQWASEPEMEKRKIMGTSVMIFLFILAILFFFAKKQIWSKVN